MKNNERKNNFFNYLIKMTYIITIIIIIIFLNSFSINTFLNGDPNPNPFICISLFGILSIILNFG